MSLQPEPYQSSSSSPPQPGSYALRVLLNLKQQGWAVVFVPSLARLTSPDALLEAARALGWVAGTKAGVSIIRIPQHPGRHRFGRSPKFPEGVNVYAAEAEAARGRTRYQRARS